MLLSKLKDFSRIVRNPKKIIDLSLLQHQLTNGLLDAMEKTFLAQLNMQTNSQYTTTDIDKIIQDYAQKNMILAAATSIIPGPMGILGAVPELILNFKNQMGMIYDLGCANDKENFLNKDLLLDIPIAAFGGNTNLALLQDCENLLDSPQTVLKEKVTTLGKGIIDRNVKKSIVQFLPVAGPVLMGIWTKATTHKIATTSKSFFDQSIIYKEHFKKEETPEITNALQVQKIKGLANLIEANNDINEAQIAFLAPIIENADLPANQKNHLLEEALRTGSNFQLDYELLQDYEEDEPLIMEMAILAKRSGHIDQLEKAYIHKEARALKLDEGFVKGLLE